jgi:YbbR domain-containing protein
MNFLKQFAKNLPLLLSAIFLAIVVWAMAVTTTDPVEKRNYSRPVELEVSGLDPSLLITSELPEQISLTLSAPRSVWSSELSNASVIRAFLDVSGLEAGNYSLPLTLKVYAHPVRWIVTCPMSWMCASNSFTARTCRSTWCSPPAGGWL